MLSALVLVAALVAPATGSAERIKFEDRSRPVKVLLLSSSLGKWRFGSFAQYLERACPNVEMVKRTKHAVNTRWMIKQFKRQVVNNPAIRPRSTEHWLLYQGGLNSVGNPERTIADQVKLFTLAHKRGFKVAALSVTPWGEDEDKRFDGFGGLEIHDKTRKVARFIGGKLKRQEALGRYAKDDRDEWRPEELPDAAADVLHDADLRHEDAPLRSTAALKREWKRDRKLQRRYPNLDEAVRRAAEVPRWFLKPKYAVDHVHINNKGHRVIAAALCPKLPASWGCDCPLIDRLGWITGQGVIVRD